MGKFVKNEMIMKPDWFLEGVYADGIDEEKIHLLMLANKQKFDRFIKKNDLSKMYEIIFHYLNLNSLFADHRVHNERYYKIENDKRLDLLVKGLKNKKEGEAFDMLRMMNDSYLEILSSYMEIALSLFGKVRITARNQNVHVECNDIFSLVNVTSCDVFELWKMVYDADETLGNKMKNLANINVPKTDISEYRNFVDGYNKKSVETRINDKSVIGINTDLAEDTRNIVYMVKDICMLNKLFYMNTKFEMFVFHRIMDTIKDKGVFPFKLTI